MRGLQSKYFKEYTEGRFKSDLKTFGEKLAAKPHFKVRSPLFSNLANGEPQPAMLQNRLSSKHLRAMLADSLSPNPSDAKSKVGNYSEMLLGKISDRKASYKFRDRSAAAIISHHQLPQLERGSWKKTPAYLCLESQRMSERKSVLKDSAISRYLGKGCAGEDKLNKASKVPSGEPAVSRFSIVDRPVHAKQRSSFPRIPKGPLAVLGKADQAEPRISDKSTNPSLKNDSCVSRGPVLARIDPKVLRPCE